MKREVGCFFSNSYLLTDRVKKEEKQITAGDVGKKERRGAF